MSGTSVKIFGNDIAMDLREDFNDLYGIGKSLDEIHQYIFSYQPLDEDEDACAYWSALALIEWEYGVLDKQVKEKTEYIIENNDDSHLYMKEKDRELRRVELNKLISKINTYNLSPKKRRKTFVYRCPYKVGDVLALPIMDKYVYLHVCEVRRKKAIKELENDELFVKVFDKTSDQLLSIKDLKPRLFHKPKYIILDKFDIHCDVKWLWCVGIREKNMLEKKIKVIGNIPIKPKSDNIVFADFQFKKVEDTLSNLFNITGKNDI